MPAQAASAAETAATADSTRSKSKALDDAGSSELPAAAENVLSMDIDVGGPHPQFRSMKML